MQQPPLEKGELSSVKACAANLILNEPCELKPSS